MGSGINSSAQGKYAGNDGSADIEIKPGFKPKVVKIRSLEGEVVLHEGMPGAWYQTDAAVPSHLAADELEFTEFGFKMKGNIAGVSSDTVDYYYECY